MARTVGIGKQDFEKVRKEGVFYVDKTKFIREWWESGFGRYDVMLEPRGPEDDGIILEFKVQDRTEEKNLSDTADAALKQIKEKKYKTALTEKGIGEGNIRCYGFAFCGKQVLIKN